MSSFLIELSFFELLKVRIPIPCKIVTPTNATVVLPLSYPVDSGRFARRNCRVCGTAYADFQQVTTGRITSGYSIAPSFFITLLTLEQLRMT